MAIYAFTSNFEIQKFHEDYPQFTGNAEIQDPTDQSQHIKRLSEHEFEITQSESEAMNYHHRNFQIEVPVVIIRRRELKQPAAQIENIDESKGTQKKTMKSRHSLTEPVTTEIIRMVDDGRNALVQKNAEELF